jgi:hypothetical protein
VPARSRKKEWGAAMIPVWQIVRAHAAEFRDTRNRVQVD